MGPSLIFILRKDIGVGGPENGNFPLLYVVEMSLRRWVVQKSLNTPLHNIKMALNTVKIGFKERLNKELSISESFSVNSMPVHLINILNKLALVNNCGTTKSFLILPSLTGDLSDLPDLPDLPDLTEIIDL